MGAAAEILLLATIILVSGIADAGHEQFFQYGEIQS
jgi:hypothetical protein